MANEFKLKVGLLFHPRMPIFFLFLDTFMITCYKYCCINYCWNRVKVGQVLISPWLVE